MKHVNTLCGQDAMLLTFFFFILMEVIHILPGCFEGLKDKIRLKLSQ
jgi:hypothetical protein